MNVPDEAGQLAFDKHQKLAKDYDDLKKIYDASPDDQKKILRPTLDRKMAERDEAKLEMDRTYKRKARETAIAGPVVKVKLPYTQRKEYMNSDYSQGRFASWSGRDSLEVPVDLFYLEDSVERLLRTKVQLQVAIAFFGIVGLILLALGLHALSSARLEAAALWRHTKRLENRLEALRRSIPDTVTQRAED